METSKPDLPTVAETMMPDATAPSTSDGNVARARRRADAVPAETQAAALRATADAIMAMSRQPFREALIALVGASPTPEAVRRFADRYPDRWAQAVSIMGGMAGFSRETVELNVFNVKGLADSELMARLSSLDAKLAGVAGVLRKPPSVVDAEVIERKEEIEVADSAGAASPASRAAGDTE